MRILVTTTGLVQRFYAAFMILRFLDYLDITSDATVCTTLYESSRSAEERCCVVARHGEASVGRHDRGGSQNASKKGGRNE
jgi:hypothetical protein